MIQTYSEKLKMKALSLFRPLSFSLSPSCSRPYFRHKPIFRVSCSSLRSEQVKVEDTSTTSEYKPGLFDDFFLTLFLNKMVKEVGWDSEKPGYDGLIEVANRLMLTGRTNADTKDAAVRILRSLFPPLLLDLYKLLISSIGGGKLAALMVVNSVDLPDGTSCESGVFVERCKYLEGSKCIGICVNTCKLPTEAFFKDYTGVPLLIEPNFTDYSCQFKVGVIPPKPEDDSALKEACLEGCPVASRRRQVAQNIDVGQCPMA